MQDQMKFSEHVQVSLECGHPNKNAGEMCENCGQVVPGVQSKAELPKELAGQELKEPAKEE